MKLLLGRTVALTLSILITTTIFMSTARAQSESALGRLSLDELRAFAEAYDRIKMAYVEQVDDKTLLRNAIRGMLDGLDPHSAYLDARDFDSLQTNTSGEFGGVGLEVGVQDGYVLVVSPIDNTPAEKAGIKSGDLIIKLDDKSVVGMSLSDAIKYMKGKPGSVIKITVSRDGSAEPIEFDITRDVIQVSSINTRWLDSGYGYMRISQFQSNSGKELVKSIAKFKKQADIKGLVLDLRNNPGGVLKASVEVVDAFIDDGLIVYTEGRLKDSKVSYRATSSNPGKGIPLVVLINGGSASASEIVAGALQDHKRAVIMGTSSFGKGSVQTVLPLTEDRALKLTTGLYFTPEGRSIQAQGIVPDIVIAQSKITEIDRPKRFKEVDLPGHLENKTDSSKNTIKSLEKPLNANDDYQLYQALSLLKGINVAASSPSID